MPKHRNVLLVLADGEHARFVRPGTDFALHSEDTIDSVTAHKQSSDLGSDHPGASFHSDATHHSSEAPRHDLHVLEKEKFARLVAEQLNVAAARDEFVELILVAPSHTLAGIRDHLDGRAAGRIIGTLHKDLLKTPDDELWPHVREWLRPTHRQA